MADRVTLLFSCKTFQPGTAAIDAVSPNNIFSAEYSPILMFPAPEDIFTPRTNTVIVPFVVKFVNCIFDTLPAFDIVGYSAVCIRVPPYRETAAGNLFL